MDDGLAWFCESCNNKLYEESFKLDDIESDLPKIFKKYYGDEKHLTCDSCGTVMEEPQKV